MILIFGGTTEGRIAVEVCDQAGKPFFYSTKGNLQDVEMHNGVRLSGVLSAKDFLHAPLHRLYHRCSPSLCRKSP